MGYHGAQVFLDQFRIVADGFGNRAEDHAGLGQRLFEGGGYGNRVKYCVHGNAGQFFALVQGNAQLFVGFQQLRIHFIQALWHILFALGRGIIGNRVVVDFRVADMSPVRLFHFQPATIGFEAPFQHPFRLFLYGGKAGNDVFVQAGFERVGFDFSHETVFVFPFDQLFHLVVGGRHDRRSVILSSRACALCVIGSPYWAGGWVYSICCCRSGRSLREYALQSVFG